MPPGVVRQCHQVLHQVLSVVTSQYAFCMLKAATSLFQVFPAALSQPVLVFPGSHQTRLLKPPPPRNQPPPSPEPEQLPATIHSSLKYFLKKKPPITQKNRMNEEAARYTCTYSQLLICYSDLFDFSESFFIPTRHTPNHVGVYLLYIYQTYSTHNNLKEGKEHIDTYGSQKYKLRLL